MPVVFSEAGHTYTNPDTGERYISATTLLGKYKPEFDADAAAARVAAREFVSKEFILDVWKNVNDEANERGTKIHKSYEDYINDGTVTDYNRKNIEALDGILAQLGSGKKITKQSEVILYNDDLKLAGMTDLLIENGYNDTFAIWDFKTNKEFKMFSKYNEFLLEPLSHLTCSDLTIYGLQLSLYAWMHEKLTGKKCYSLKILYTPSIIGTDDVKDITEIDIPYMKSDIEKLLTHYEGN